MDLPDPVLPTLSAPTVRVRASFLAGMAQFKAEGRGQPDDDSVLGQQLRRYGGRWGSPEGFADYVTALLAEALPDTPRPGGIVASTDLWWISGSTFLGRVSIRHALTDRLRDSGGHIGYDVVPSARSQGHATAMLAAALHVAARPGVTSALLTGVPTNVGSRRVIERNGGIPDSADEHVLRFWIPTGASPSLTSGQPSHGRAPRAPGAPRPGPLTLPVPEICWRGPEASPQSVFWNSASTLRGTRTAPGGVLVARHSSAMTGSCGLARHSPGHLLAVGGVSRHALQTLIMDVREVVAVYEAGDEDARLGLARNLVEWGTHL